MSFQSSSSSFMDEDQCITFLQSQPCALRMCLGFTGLGVSARRSHPHQISIANMQVVKVDSDHFVLRIPSNLKTKCATCSELTPLHTACVVRAGQWAKTCTVCQGRGRNGRVVCGESCTGREQAIHTGLVCSRCAAIHKNQWNNDYHADTNLEGSEYRVIGKNIHCLYSAVRNAAESELLIPPLEGIDSFWLFNPKDRCKVSKVIHAPQWPGFPERSWCDDNYY